ncbi:response regulator transcription factor [Alkalicoccus daliensis]|uniref:Two-component system, response regulator YesN n=1 Tax=Alkalicoccus daliensis TaxID=745820 RepID=A0A1H0GEV4_9BACI|nr:response regulator [Alkalicoccus daliensis]SDO05388.1 two-component system, response regulator YesN [Alkalicoccus daliensis]
MYSVLLVDDEKLILESLEKTFPWEELDCSIVGTASNGQEALRKYQALLPNIVITDIKMPDMTGIEFLETIFSQREVDEVIVLSGYDDFEYVRSALQFRAFHYLLKPLDRAELKEVLLDAKKQINKKKEAQIAAWKTQLYEAIFTKKQHTTLPFSNYTLMVIEHTDPADWQELYFTAEYIFAYPLSADTVLLAGTGEQAPEQMKKQFLTVSAEQPSLKAAISPMIDTPEELNEAFKSAQEYLDKQSFIAASLITSDLYEEYVSQESVTHKYIYEAKEYVTRHCHDHLRSEDVAKKFGFSTSYFSTLYKQAHGISFSDHIKTERLKKAQQLLTETNKPAYEVAEIVGYEDQRYFSQVFKKEFGFTPSDYRKKHTKLR